MIHFDEPHLTIHFDEGVGAVWMEWKRFVEGETFRRGLDDGIALLAQQKAQKWVVDLRHIGPVTADDQRWSSDDWFPRALAAGIRWMAFVASKKAVVQMNVKLTMARVYDRELVTAYFDNVEEAKAWLKDQK